MDLRRASRSLCQPADRCVASSQRCPLWLSKTRTEAHGTTASSVRRASRLSLPFWWSVCFYVDMSRVHILQYGNFGNKTC
jgi:hypothetical protein